MADSLSSQLRDGVSREPAAVAICALALFVSLSLVFYAQLLWLSAFGATGAFELSWLPWRAVLVVVPAATVAAVPGVVATLVSETVPARAVWLLSSVVVALTLGLHDLLYGPIYLIG